MTNAVDDVFKFTIRQALAGQVIVNDWFLRVMALPGAIDQATMLETANQIKEVLRGVQVDDLTYTTWSARKVRGDLVVRDNATCKISGGEQFEGPFTGTLTGANTTFESLPPQDAMVATLKTGFAGRSRRGRHYIAGLGENTQNAGTFQASDLNTVQSAYNAYGAANKPSAVEPIFEWGVFSETLASGCKPAALHPHRRVNVQPRNEADAYRAITEVVVRNLVRTQRRRQIGVGQ